MYGFGCVPMNSDDPFKSARPVATVAVLILVTLVSSVIITKLLGGEIGNLAIVLFLFTAALLFVRRSY